MKKEIKKAEPIYEKLAPGEVLIITKEENCVTYATNEKGEVLLKKAYLLPED
jgi:predicted transcriptional regulator